jgi:glycosyltransferase involved in cell wall biosynthesis
MRIDILKILTRRRWYDLVHSDSMKRIVGGAMLGGVGVTGMLFAITGSPRLKRLKFRFLFTAARTESNLLPDIRKQIDLYLPDIGELMPLGRYKKSVNMRRSIILKWPVMVGGRVQEKGVLLLKFTHTFEYYIRHIDMEKLLSAYYLVLEPSWSGYCDPNILYWMKHPQHKIIIQASEVMDYEFIRKLQSNLVPAEFGASDWVDDRIFHRIAGISKKYDVVYVASYSTWKRHHILFRAIRQLNDPSLLVALVGFPWMGTRGEIELLIDHYGIKNNIEIFENVKPDGVNELLNMAKVSVLLSLREGSNKAIFEGFFAGVPAIVLRNNIGVNKEYINSMTGMLIDEKDLPSAISHFRNNWHTYRPYEWAAENIAPEVTTVKLNNMLKDIALSNNERWTSDIMVKVNAPELFYYHDMNEARIIECGRVIEEGYGLH